MTSIIKKKEADVISKEIIVRNITEDINTNAQAEEGFRIKKYSSFKEKDVSICEFIKRNYEDNIALRRETVDACLQKISKRKKLARKKQDKCLIKVCEKIMNGVKGPLYGHQTDDEDSLSDTNKPKEDQEKWGLNRKVKTLKRSWSYLKESCQILEPSSKSGKISPKVRKNTTKFKNKNEEIWKEEATKSTKYKEVDQKSNEKAEKILKQENCVGEVKTTKKCFKYCFALSLQSNYLYCFKCIIVLYSNIGNFLAFHHSKNLEILLQDWNTSGELSLQSFVFLDDEKLKTFRDTIKPSQRGFLNIQSN